MIRALAPLLVLLLVLVVAVPALAVPPVGSSGHDDSDFYLFTCPQGFDIYDHAVGDYHQKIFYDQDGNPIRLSGSNTGYDSLHRQGDETKVLSYKFGFSYHVDYITQLGKITGSIMNTHLPDGGIAYKSSGQVLWDTTVWEIVKRAGLEYVDVDFICSYLAP